MSDYRKCARCGVADKDVHKLEYGSEAIHCRASDTRVDQEFEHCISALQRELAQRDELLRETLAEWRGLEQQLTALAEGRTTEPSQWAVAVREHVRVEIADIEDALK